MGFTPTSSVHAVSRAWTVQAVSIPFGVLRTRIEQRGLARLVELPPPTTVTTVLFLFLVAERNAAYTATTVGEAHTFAGPQSRRSRKGAHGLPRPGQRGRKHPSGIRRSALVAGGTADTLYPPLSMKCYTVSVSGSGQLLTGVLDVPTELGETHLHYG